MEENKEEYFTFEELLKRFNWNFKGYQITKEAQIRWVAAKGVEIEAVKKEKQSWVFKILNDVSNTYSQQQIIEKYNLVPEEERKNKIIPDFLSFAEKRGILLERYDFCKRPYYYKIIDDHISSYEWVTSKTNSNFEVCKEGYVRHRIKKNIYNCSNVYGYIQIVDTKKNFCYLAHRLIMETFNPIENMNNMIVDHINGIRSDNRLENLRWATQEENMQFKTEQWTSLKNKISQLIRKIGYDKLNEILDNQLKNF